jgi:hypothetical protein
VLSIVKQACSTAARHTARRTLAGCALATALLLGAHVGVATAAATRTGRVQCGRAICTDTWKFTCPASDVMSARVVDLSGADDFLMVVVTGFDPGSIKGSAQFRIAETPGAFSTFANAFSSLRTGISAYAVVTNLSDTDSADYAIEFSCSQGNGIEPEPSGIRLLQDR